MSQRKKGRYVMLDYKSLKTRFGPALAKQIRDEKKALEKAKGPEDNIVHWMQHPDTASEAGVLGVS